MLAASVSQFLLVRIFAWQNLTLRATQRRLFIFPEQNCVLPGIYILIRPRFFMGRTC